jgi:hypothetical protein
MYRLGAVLVESGRVDAAESLWAHWARQHENPHAMYSLGTAYAGCGNLTDAEYWLRRAVFVADVVVFDIGAKRQRRGGGTGAAVGVQFEARPELAGTTWSVTARVAMSGPESRAAHGNRVSRQDSAAAAVSV